MTKQIIINVCSECPHFRFGRSIRESFCFYGQHRSSHTVSRVLDHNIHVAIDPLCELDDVTISDA